MPDERHIDIVNFGGVISTRHVIILVKGCCQTKRLQQLLVTPPANSLPAKRASTVWERCITV